LGSLKLIPGSGFTMLGALSPFCVDPEDAGGGDGLPVPGVEPSVFPKLELPRGREGSSSLQPKATRRAANATFRGEVSVQPP
jgi:hypothetical protein